MQIGVQKLSFFGIIFEWNVSTSVIILYDDACSGRNRYPIPMLFPVERFANNGLLMFGGSFVALKLFIIIVFFSKQKKKERNYLHATLWARHLYFNSFRRPYAKCKWKKFYAILFWFSYYSLRAFISGNKRIEEPQMKWTKCCRCRYMHSLWS